MTKIAYTGRFAPTPSGALHFGSIIAALGSYLQARHQNGKWLVRIDDVDINRSRHDAVTQILNQLEHLGLFWDDEIVFQSKRNDLYEQALATLIQQDLIYACQCSRKQVGVRPYPATCRNLALPINESHALRINTKDVTIILRDQLQDEIKTTLQHSQGDFIVKRADGLFAYHLASVVDDQLQGVTEIVRGADLYSSTPAQRYLQQRLSFNEPGYIHLPVALDNHGKKISKSDGQHILDMKKPINIIYQALLFLGQNIPGRNDFDHIEDLLSFAIQHWRIDNIPKKETVAIINE